MAYQGWKNWATWNIVLWFGNDQGLYGVIRDYRGKFTGPKAKELVLELLPDGTPDMADLSKAKLHAAYASVSWTEIAKDFNEMKE